MSAQKSQKTRRLPLRRHSLADHKRSGGQAKEERGRSFISYLKNKPWKRRSVSTPSIDKELLPPEATPMEPPTGGPSVRVVASVLHPQLYYKTLPITMTTTVYDVITSLVNKFAMCTEDQNPDSFYLMETHDTQQGSYSRVVASTDQIQDIQLRWGSDPGYFTLSRRPKLNKTDPAFSSSPSLLFSTTDSALFSYPVFVEEGNSQLSSQSQNDLTTEPHLTSSSHTSTTPHSSVSLVSPFSHGAAQKLSKTEKAQGQNLRLRESMGSSLSTSYSLDSTSPPLSPASPVIVESPTHQYVITGSSSSHSNGGSHGNIAGTPVEGQGRGRREGGEENEVFHFPSADPGSPTGMGFYDNMLGMEGSFGRKMWIEEKRWEGEEERGRGVREGMREVAMQETEGGGGRGGEGGGGDEVTPHTKRRRRLSEMMQQSIEGGLGHIMTMVVKEGQTNGTAGKEEVEVEGEDIPVREREEREEEYIVPSIPPAKENPGVGSSPLTPDHTHNDNPSPPETESHSQTVEPNSKHQTCPQSRTVSVEATLSLPQATLTHSLPHTVTTHLSVSPTTLTRATLCLSRAKPSEFQSEMNMLDSLASLLDVTLRAMKTVVEEGRGGRGGGKGEGGERRDTNLLEKNRRRSESGVSSSTNQNETSSGSDSLISPFRRSKLIDQAARKVSLRRAKTFNTGDTRPQVQRRREEERELMSSAHRERLLQQALAAVRLRRQATTATPRGDGGGSIGGQAVGGSLFEGGGRNGEVGTGLKRRQTFSEWDISKYSSASSPSSSPHPPQVAGRAAGNRVRPASAATYHSSPSSSASSSPAPLPRPLLQHNPYHKSLPSLTSDHPSRENGTPVTMATSGHAPRHNKRHSPPPYSGQPVAHWRDQRHTPPPSLPPPHTNLIHSSRVSTSLQTLTPSPLSPPPEEDEVLCTFSSHHRPVTVVMRRSSTASTSSHTHSQSSPMETTSHTPSPPPLDPPTPPPTPSQLSER